MNIDDSLWTTMKIHAFYHEIPWMSMYIHGLSSPISTGVFSKSIRFHLYMRPACNFVTILYNIDRLVATIRIMVALVDMFN